MRQFVVDTEPDLKGMIYISGKDYKYIRQVLRLNVGDMIKVACGVNSYDTTLCSIDDNKKKITLQLCDVQPEQTSLEKPDPDKPEFWLLQFIPKHQKMELIVRQAVENGTSVIIPVIGEFTQKGSENILGKKSDRIERIIREARQQSGSPLDTKVLEPVSLEAALKLIAEKQASVEQNNKSCVKTSLYERNEESVTMHQAVWQAAEKNPVGFAIAAIGCEGGISPAEIALLKRSGFSTVHFDVNILRCETASLYGMAALQTSVLEIKKWQLKE